ncbi:PRC-barrel domain-containing protein [Alkalihalobacillus sp. BA299]|uniref:PRC-barrel domain-containing protein n=1 Tax=Alkalihalobacillus sp. BA299 TaxID=2815938 RepID=UPI001ADB0149|nr:PRC-barrel domain-containing protein [Alkalihalobacillus sp. BA299]
MRTFASICGHSIFCSKTGEEIGIVNDLLLNDRGVVIGLVIDKKGWFNRHLFVPIDAVTGFGHDSLMVHDHENTTVYYKKKNEHPLKQGKEKLSGRPLLTSEGEKLGLVEDVYFMEELGTIVGYEVTEGLIADIKEGRKVVKTDRPLTIGKDILVVQL